MNQFVAAAVQLSASDDPAANLTTTEALIREAHAKGADLIATPEVTNIVSMSRKHQRATLSHEQDDITLSHLRNLADELNKWLLIGSLALKGEGPDPRFVNRSFLITPNGEICARYDKIHMFDANPQDGEVYRESTGYKPGDQAVLARTLLADIGVTICYDIRFPELYLKLARAGATVLTAPAAFSRPTGAAHWETLLRARSIETGCFMIAPAQCGVHQSSAGPARETWGHSLIISPWGNILAEADETPGVILATINPAEARNARARVPNLSGARVIYGP